MTHLRNQHAAPPGGTWRIGLFDDSELVLAGLVALLAIPASGAAGPAPIEVVALRDLADREADVELVLADPRHLLGRRAALHGRLDDRGVRVVAFGWQLERAQVRELLARGVAGCLTKRLGSAELVEALEALRRGERLVRSRSFLGERPVAEDDRARLTSRERETLALIADGLTNQEIASRLYVSINSVKSFIRTAYRKIGVSTRARAVAWQLRFRG